MHNVSVAETLQLEGHAFSFLPTNWTYIQNKSRVSFHYFANFWRAFINADENNLKNFKQGKHAKTQFVRQKDVRDKVGLESHVSCQTSQIDDVQYCRSQRSVWCQRYICDQMLGFSMKFGLVVKVGCLTSWWTLGLSLVKFGHRFRWVGYQLPSLVNLCLSDKSTGLHGALLSSIYRTLSLQKLNIGHWIEIEHIEQNSEIE